MFNIDHLVTGINDTLKVASPVSGRIWKYVIRPTGTRPVATSSLYTDSLVVTNDITINAATFTNGKQMGKNLTLPLHWNKATARPVQDGNNQTYRLTSGLRGSNKQSDFEWCGWYDEDATFTIDLGKTEAINEITIGCITNYGMGAHDPWPDYVVRLRRQPDILRRLQNAVLLRKKYSAKVSASKTRHSTI